jgi:hypothetical protein
MRLLRAVSLGWFLRGGVDWRVVRDSGRLAPIFGVGGDCPMALWHDRDSGQLPLDVL